MKSFAFGLRLWLPLCLCTGAIAQAQSVSLAGRMGDRALLVVNGQPLTVAVGATAGGVRLLRWAGDEAEVEMAGAKSRLRVGGTPAQIGAALAPGAAREIVMAVGSGGHFMPTGAINGQAVRFVVDTGATLVAQIGRAHV